MAQKVNFISVADAIPIKWMKERVGELLNVPEGEYGYDLAQREADKYLCVIERWRREQDKVKYGSD